MLEITCKGSYTFFALTKLDKGMYTLPIRMFSVFPELHQAFKHCKR